MAQLAVLLTERGFKVTGSDKEFYEPMASLLSKAKVHTYQGYSANNISSQLDLVIIGNAVSYGHVEVAEVERLQIPYSIFPRILAEMIIADKHSLVVCGTHGKTTTSGMAAFVLRELGADPSYFVGGVCRELERSMAEGSGSCSVVEGDEYDSSFFAKVPKFKFYRPDSLIITSLEYDHADIYPDIESIEAVFAELVSRMDSESRCAVCIDDANIAKLIPSWRRNSKGGFLTYGSSSAADYILEHTAIEGGMQKVRYTSKMYGGAEFEIPLIGGYNAKNALAVLAVLTGLGFERNKVFAALKRYTGVKRRQELRFNGEVTVIEDFAHHPSAVRETIAAVKQAYPGRRLWSVFEPRSNTSRLKIFEREYLQAFDGAELIILCQVD
ncbi:MAG: UDP-N-acetylmuramate:L-alanyl-gamma-D-glutamyl-meso-diaminopimelate ligase, partial [Proteobacteria bacterium]